MWGYTPEPCLPFPESEGRGWLGSNSGASGPQISLPSSGCLAGWWVVGRDRGALGGGSDFLGGGGEREYEQMMIEVVVVNRWR